MTYSKAFDDPVLDSQRTFRLMLQAMSQPGTIVTLPALPEAPGGLHGATAAACLTLVDHETPIWLAGGEAAEPGDWIRFHTGAKLVSRPLDARFAVVAGGEKGVALAEFDAGEERYPDRSATLIVECTMLELGELVTIAGPGIDGERTIAPAGLRAGFWNEVLESHARYPLGVDIFLVSGQHLMALPRSTSIGRKGDT
jgi:alpha-D-ribose 1-methylphosphonate 5-triphosphate synthase subunit PhnH